MKTIKRIVYEAIAYIAVGGTMAIMILCLLTPQ